VAMVASIVPTFKIININKTCNKTIHLLMEMNNYISEGLIHIKALMLVIIVSVVRELGIMHLVDGSKFYKTTSRVVT
jgi:hypothetical protein